MNKVATTYWDNTGTAAAAVFIPGASKRPRLSRTRSAVPKRKAAAAAKMVRREKTSSQWLVFTVIVVLSSMICLTANLRAYGELNEEMKQHQFLNQEVEQLTTENLVLQEEIQQIKTDSTVIEREARKLGMSRPNEKVLVPAN